MYLYDIKRVTARDEDNRVCGNAITTAKKKKLKEKLKIQKKKTHTHRR